MDERVTIGDKNVIAGDVIGKKESYYLSDHAKVIKEADESQKIIVCSICGRRSIAANTHLCPSCGDSVCLDCFDRHQMVCSKCAGEKDGQGNSIAGMENDFSSDNGGLTKSFDESDDNHARYLAQKQRHADCEAKGIQKTMGSIGAFVLAFFLLCVIPGFWMTLLFLALTIITGLCMIAEGFERNVLIGLVELLISGGLIVLYLIAQFSRLF